MDELLLLRLTISSALLTIVSSLSIYMVQVGILPSETSALAFLPFGLGAISVCSILNATTVLLFVMTVILLHKSDVARAKKNQGEGETER